MEENKERAYDLKAKRKRKAKKKCIKLKECEMTKKKRVLGEPDIRRKEIRRGRCTKPSKGENEKKKKH